MNTKKIKHDKPTKPVSVQDLIDAKWKRSASDVAMLSPEDLALLRSKQEEEAEELRAEYPPGKSYFSYILPNDDDYRSMTSLPSVELMDLTRAMRLTAGMISCISHGSHHGRSMIIVAMHHNSRVVEYTFDLVVDKAGDLTLYEPFM